jgi:hypothetical protein
MEGPAPRRGVRRWIPGKTDMGDILASVSTNDGDTRAIRFTCSASRSAGTIQFAYANAILFKPFGQTCHGLSPCAAR